MDYRLALKEDIPGVLALHRRYHIDSISETDKSDGFVTTLLDEELLTELIDKERGLVIAEDKGTIIGFVMSASWDYCSKWPLFQYMIGKLNEIEYLGRKITTENSYQYGPVCIDRDYRGTGVLEGLFEFARIEMQSRYPILVTFVSPGNPRSVRAHTEKLKLEKVQEFEFNGKSYNELVYYTSRPLEQPHT